MNPLPMEYEKDNDTSTKLFSDPRTKEGEILTNRENKESLDKKKIEMGSYGYAGQCQQRPSPREGGHIKHSDIKFWDELPEVIRWVSSWDTATSEKKQSAFTVGMLWAECETGWHLVDLFREQIEFPELEKMFGIFYNKQPVSCALVEAKSSGIQIIQVFEKAVNGILIPIERIEPVGDKVQRLILCSPSFRSGHVHIPRHKSWTQDVVDEWVNFPNWPTKDITDATSQLLNWATFNQVVAPQFWSFND